MLYCILGVPYNLLPVSCGDVGFKKSIGKILAWELGHKLNIKYRKYVYSMQTRLMYVFFYLKCEKWLLYSAAGCHNRHSKIKFKKMAPNRHNNLQRAVLPDWVGSITRGVYLKVEKLKSENLIK